MTRFIWLIVGWVAVGLALIGLALPIVPTVPFLLVAVWAFGRSSERLRERLLSDPIFGPEIRKWQEDGAISRSAKVLSTVTMAGSLVLGIWLDLPTYALSIQAIILTGVAAYILSRPDA
ncbi:MAG: YbaN family protein [Paracoccaceae bacterium]